MVDRKMLKMQRCQPTASLDGLRKVLQYVQKLIFAMGWVNYERNEDRPISDQTVNDLILRMKDFVSQVYTDSNRICGKRLSMPSAKFIEEMKSDLSTLHEQRETERLTETWGNRCKQLAEKFDVSV